MLKKLIHYKDFDGNERTEEFYFNLTKGEVVKMELTGEDNSYAATLQRISDSKSGKLIIPEFERILAASYGERSEDGKRFIKSKQLSEEFSQTAAYSELFFTLTTDAGAAAEFVRAVFPAEMTGGAADTRSTAEIARERSEASLQGFQKKQPREPETVIVPELPTSSPELESDSAGTDNVRKPTRAELEAQLAALDD